MTCKTQESSRGRTAGAKAPRVGTRLPRGFIPKARGIPRSSQRPHSTPSAGKLRTCGRKVASIRSWRTHGPRSLSIYYRDIPYIWNRSNDNHIYGATNDRDFNLWTSS